MTSLLLLKSMLFAKAFQKRKKRKKTKLNKTHKMDQLDVCLCRLCNDKKGDIPIFDNFLQPDIPEQIHIFSGITLNKTDNLSKHMCQTCLDLLNRCIMFRDMCQKTNKELTELAIKEELIEAEQPQYECKNENADSESYNIPSPSFSDDCSKLSIWDCSVCCKEFPDIKSYNKHFSKCQSKHKTEELSKPSEELTKKKFLCDICGKTASSNASLLVHMGTHENIFPFKCDVCPYQGRTMDLLKVHKRSHMTDKPFKCSQCPKATTTASNLSKHMRHVHSTTRPYKCTYCDKAFSYQHDMKRHLKDIHLRQGTVECEICYKKFSTKKILQGHRWKVHKIKGERQGRLPSYLQCRINDKSKGNHVNDKVCDDSDMPIVAQPVS